MMLVSVNLPTGVRRTRDLVWRVTAQMPLHMSNAALLHSVTMAMVTAEFGALAAAMVVVMVILLGINLYS